VKKSITGYLLFLLCLLSIIRFTGCYSFTGASVPPHLKTIAIPLFDDQSGSGEPNLREQLTQKLLDGFMRDNNFQLTDKKSCDALLLGMISSLQNEPAVVTRGVTTKTNRITITVKASFRDQKLKKDMWEKQFSRYADFEISGGFSAKQAAIATVLDQLSEDILLETVSGW